MTIYNVVSRDTLALVEDLNSLRVSEAKAWALATELRRVLEMVEWCDGACFWCHSLQTNGHKPDCPRQLALYPPEPEPGG